jgi:hypothetical protein
MIIIYGNFTFFGKKQNNQIHKYFLPFLQNKGQPQDFSCYQFSQFSGAMEKNVIT